MYIPLQKRCKFKSIQWNQNVVLKQITGRPLASCLYQQLLHYLILFTNRIIYNLSYLSIIYLNIHLLISTDYYTTQFP